MLTLSHMSFPKLKPVTALAALAVVGAAALSCVTAPEVRTDADPTANFSKYRTFEFMGGKSVLRYGAVQVTNPFVSDEVREAVSRQLQAKGLTPTTTNPDLLVTFVSGARKKTEIEDTGPSFYGRYGWVGYGPGWWGPGYDSWWTYSYNEGTLIVDLIDARTKRLVWRAYAKGEVEDPTKAKPLVDNAIARAFQHFPPAPGYGGAGQ
jgi:hypothetical protein